VLTSPSGPGDKLFGMRSAPLPIVIVRVIIACQLPALLVGAVAAAAYVHKSGIDRTSSEDAQFAQLGYGFACALAVALVVALAVGLRRLGTGPGRGRLLLVIGEGDLAVGALTVGVSIDSDRGPSPIAARLLVWLAVSALVVIAALVMPRARAWIAGQA
jgi:hypothetical protein